MIPECIKTGNHHLVVVYENGHDLCSDVVRWCTKCGAIVVDVDYDGRTKPGQIMKMKAPAIVLSEMQPEKSTTLRDSLISRLAELRKQQRPTMDEEIAESLIPIISEALPKMEGAMPNANSKYEVPYEELSYAMQQEHEGTVRGWCDCVEAIKKALE